MTEKRHAERRVRRVAIGVVGVLFGLSTADARAEGTLSPTGANVVPVQQRFAIATSTARTTTFSELKLTSDAGLVAIVVPVPTGASLDWSSRAFFEALEESTAPRVIATDPIAARCASSDDSAVASVEADLDDIDPIEPVEVAILDDAAAVTAWATARNLEVSLALETAMATRPLDRFFVALYQPGNEIVRTKTLRVVYPSTDNRVPLVFTLAGPSDVDVTTWTIGAQRASVSGTNVDLDLSTLSLDVGHQTSNYQSILHDTLAGADSIVFQMSSHQSLRDQLSAVDDGPLIQGFIHSYFERGALYGEAPDTPSSCTQASSVILSQSARVGVACPRTALGVVGGDPSCTADVTQPGEVDPALLRCGSSLDDLAVMLSSFEPDEARVTRYATVVKAGAAGVERTVDFPGGDRVDPQVEAASVDLSNCQGGAGGAGGGGDGGSTGASTGSGGGKVKVPVYARDGCGSTSWVIVDYVEANEETAPDAYYEDDEDSCGSSSSSSSDSCNGDSSYSGSSDSCDCGDSTYDFSGCDCGSDDGYDTSGCDCGGDAGYDSGCDCSGFDGGDSCGGGFDECSVNRARGFRPRRVNAYAYGLLAFVIPARRWSRRKRAR
ncbi:MAG: DUF2330 domain-containing protein [Polyangiaceae bacterium]